MAVVSMTRTLAVAASAVALLSAQVHARLGGGVNSTATSESKWQPTGFEEDVQRSEAALFEPDAFARGGAARGLDFWTNDSLTAASSVEALTLASSFSTSDTYGHEYVATTTHYEDTCCSSCGSINTAALVAGTGYYAVASAQAMQNHFHAGSCCWCGQAGGACGHGSGTAPMGCSACAKGRFLPKRPYSQSFGADHALFQREINIVVADICPHKGNEAWCAAQEGTTNHFGSKNHFDFANPPPGFDNFYFAFTPVPCSGDIQQRLSSMSQCSR